MMKAIYTKPAVKLYVAEADIMEEPPTVSNLYNDQPALAREQLWAEQPEEPTTVRKRASLWDE